jgi:transposase InsO family protein
MVQAQSWQRVWLDLPQRTRQPICQRGLPPSAAGLGDYRFHEPSRYCWYNACSETLFGSLKVERLHGQKFASRRHAKDETISWILRYNQSRLHSTLDYVTPVQFEQQWRTDQTVATNP